MRYELRIFGYAAGFQPTSAHGQGRFGLQLVPKSGVDHVWAPIFEKEVRAAAGAAAFTADVSGDVILVTCGLDGGERAIESIKAVVTAVNLLANERVAREARVKAQDEATRATAEKQENQFVDRMKDYFKGGA